MQDIKQNILKAIISAQTEPTDQIDIYKKPDQAEGNFANEMLFFIKPELTVESNGQIKYEKILDTVFEKLTAFGMDIQSIKLLGAKYLEESGIMASHYGVINKLSSNALGELSQTAKDTFKEKFGLAPEQAKIMGAIEFMKANDIKEALGLDVLWQNLRTEKLAGGTYCAKIAFDGQDIYLVNGFHPRQLEHFTKKGRSIILFHVKTNTDWSAARNDFIGATNPEKANDGSLRKIFLDNKEAFGLDEVSQGFNGVHLSAGPVEALAELCRFFGCDLKADVSSAKAFALGAELLASFDAKTALEIIEDKNVVLDGASSSVFEITEEKNAKDVMPLLKQANVTSL